MSEIITLFEMGGNVLYLLVLSAFIFFTLFFEKFFYLRFEFKKRAKLIIEEFSDDDRSWATTQKMYAQLSMLRVKLQSNMSVLKVIIALFPLMGLLGTVTGMIQVFDMMSSSSTTNAASMASGISMATIPTMVGMSLAVITLFMITRAQYEIKRELHKLESTLHA